MKYLFTLALVAFTIGANAQTDEEALAKMTEDLCECMGTEEEIKAIPPAEIEISLGMCIYTVSEKYTTELEAMGFDLPDDFEQLGEKLGANMMFTCGPKMLLLIEAMQQSGTIDMETFLEEDDFVVGQLTDVGTKGELMRVVLKDNNKRTVNLIWFDKVDGTVYLENFRGKTDVMYRVGFETHTMYDPRINEYCEVKVITSVRPVEQ